jgi:hypothetical protein|nr:MAG TPA: repressor protein [Caudoviricetes sp.]
MFPHNRQVKREQEFFHVHYGIFSSKSQSQDIGGDTVILDNIRAMCAKRGISTFVLERELGFGDGTIIKWKTASPTVGKLKRVADYFGVTVDELLCEPDASDEAS